MRPVLALALVATAMAMATSVRTRSRRAATAATRAASTPLRKCGASRQCHSLMETETASLMAMMPGWTVLTAAATAMLRLLSLVAAILEEEEVEGEGAWKARGQIVSPALAMASAPGEGARPRLRPSPLLFLVASLSAGEAFPPAV